MLLIASNWKSKFLVMRLFRMLCSKGTTRPQNPKRVPLAKPRLPLAVRDRVCTKKEKGGVAPALQEMQNLITKLAQNEWNQQFCQKEIIAMRNANTSSYMSFVKEKEENRTGAIKPGQNLNPVPLNKYLKRFPIQKSNAFEVEAKIVEPPPHRRKR